jgi:saccharopine dehydrogenase-like NADP-dependent oxidoreductase
MPHAVVLGGGMVGSVVARDLAEDPEVEVTLADVSAEALAATRARSGERIATAQADLSDPDTVKGIIGGADIVIGALPGFLGFAALRTVIEAGRNYCDISFMPEDPMELDEFARDKGVTAVVDCGVAPGLSHMLAACAATTLNGCERITIYVGGLPRQPEPPFNYKAPFSPVDVIELYVRPARLVEGGKVVTREALGRIEPFEFPGVGTLEAFESDGLRSLLETIDVPNMVEKTLRYPGTAELMRALREAGLFGEAPVAVGDAKVRPIDLTTAVLFPKWTYEPGEEDLTVLRVEAAGVGGGITWDVLDVYDAATGMTSMGRTTGFPCAIVARLIAQGRIAETGVIVPETLGMQPELLDHVLAELAARNVKIERH